MTVFFQHRELSSRSDRSAWAAATESLDLPFATFVVLFTMFSYSIFLVFDPKTVNMLAKEDGFFEYFGAVCLFIGSGAMFVHFWKYPSANDFFFFTTGRNYFLLLLALLFFFGAGEETSWGQRIFHSKTPEFLLEANVQHETNVHNLELFVGTNPDNERKTGWGFILGMDFLFSLFWFSYGVVIPIINRVSPSVRTFLKRINLPILPIWSSALLIMVYGISKILEPSLTFQLRNNLIEVKECDFEVLLGLASMYMFAKVRREKRVSERQP